MHWAQFMAHFPDPIHIGAHASFFIAFTSDFICSLLLVLGIWTRWAALFCFCNILVAWALVHRFAYFGRGPGSEHGELMVLYLVALLTLVVTGSSAFSVSSIRGSDIPESVTSEGPRHLRRYLTYCGNSQSPAAKDH